MAIITDKKIIEARLNFSIQRLIELLKENVNIKCTEAERYFFIAALNFLYVDEIFVNSTKGQNILRQNLSDIYKYLISLIACEKNLATEFEIESVKENIKVLIDGVRAINDNFQAINALNLYSKVSFDTDSDQIIVLIDELNTNSFISSLNFYAIRVQENLNKDLELKSFEFVIEENLDCFIPYDDLLKKGFGITITDIKQIVKRLKKQVDYRYDLEYDNFSVKGDGIIDSDDFDNHVLFTSLLIFSWVQLYEIHPKMKEFLNLFTFIPEQFDPYELRFNYIDKKSIIRLNDLYFISFELLIPSLKSGIHYSLLGFPETCEKYKKLESSIFEERISEIALKFGFITIDRNVELYEGKRNLGDIDLILKNHEGRKIYIEAKSYSLHSNIQAHDPVEMQAQLQNQKDQWESKVLTRKLHIETNEKQLIEYIIVTRKPEILSHFSELLVINIEEFEYWLKHNANMNFEEIFNQLYNKERGFMRDIFKEISPNWGV